MNPIDIEAMVNRFLAWKLPMQFAPDCGISFQAPSHPAIWPTGTNLLDAAQAREMIEHILATPAGSDSTDAARTYDAIQAIKRTALDCMPGDEKKAMGRIVRQCIDLQRALPPAATHERPSDAHIASVAWRYAVHASCGSETLSENYDILRYECREDLFNMVRACLAATQAPQADQPAEAGSDSTDAARDVLAERQRQISAEGWTPEHDDEHGEGSMAIAAACYALSGLGVHALPVAAWPVRLWGFTGWSSEWWKPKDRRSNLVRAAALILAEIERLDRAATSGSGKGQA